MAAWKDTHPDKGLAVRRDGHYLAKYSDGADSRYQARPIDQYLATEFYQGTREY